MATSNDRDGKRATPLPADFDDPSIPVLTERLTLTPLEIDFTLPPALTQPPPPLAPNPAPVPATPPGTAPALPAVAAPAARAPSPGPAPAAAPPPAIHGLDTLPPQFLSPAPAPAIAAIRVEPRVDARIEPPRVEQRPEPNWAQLEAELRESVLRELSMRLPQNVEQIVREKMQPGIQAALDRLASETRLAIAASLRDLVDKAVKAELAAMKLRGK